MHWFSGDSFVLILYVRSSCIQLSSSSKVEVPVNWAVVGGWVCSSSSLRSVQRDDSVGLLHGNGCKCTECSALWPSDHCFGWLLEPSGGGGCFPPFLGPLSGRSRSGANSRQSSVSCMVLLNSPLCLDPQ